jgi:hypothetical protein
MTDMGYGTDASVTSTSTRLRGNSGVSRLSPSDDEAIGTVGAGGVDSVEGTDVEGGPGVSAPGTPALTPRGTGSGSAHGRRGRLAMFKDADDWFERQLARFRFPYFKPTTAADAGGKAGTVAGAGPGVGAGVGSGAVVPPLDTAGVGEAGEGKEPPVAVRSPPSRRVSLVESGPFLNLAGALGSGVGTLGSGGTGGGAGAGAGSGIGAAHVGSGGVGAAGAAAPPASSLKPSSSPGSQPLPQAVTELETIKALTELMKVCGCVDVCCNAALMPVTLSSPHAHTHTPPPLTHKPLAGSLDPGSGPTVVLIVTPTANFCEPVSWLTVAGGSVLECGAWPVACPPPPDPPFPPHLDRHVAAIDIDERPERGEGGWWSGHRCWCRW